MARWISIVLVSVGAALAMVVFALGGELFGDHTLSTPHLGSIIAVVAVSAAVMAPVGLRLARWAEGPDARLPGVLADA